MTSKVNKSKPQSRSSSCTGSGSSSSYSNSSITRQRRFDVALSSPILGKNFKIPDLYSELQDIELDDTLPYVPIYCHFVVPEIQPVIRPKTPPILTALRAELEELKLTKPAKIKPEQRSRNAHHNHRQSNKNH